MAMGTGVMPTPQAAHADGGFTILELLVVFSIVALLSGLAVVSIRGTGPDGAVAEETRKLQELLELVSRESVLSFRDTGVRLTTNGFNFWSQGDGGQWKVIKGDDLLRERFLPEGMILEAWVEDVPVGLGEEMEPETQGVDAEPPRPHLYFFSNGERVPFRVKISSTAGPQREIVGGIVGNIKVEIPNNAL